MVFGGRSAHSVNHGPGRVIVNGFKVFDRDPKAGKAGVIRQGIGHVANHVLDEFRIVEGVLGDEFFISAFEQAPERAGTLILDAANQVGQ